MNVEIWSDVMCPFCYIGKRRFEGALVQFAHKKDVNIIWRSFQLNPDVQAEAGKGLNEYLAEHKGWSLQQAKEANDYVSNMAKAEGLEYHLEKAVVANSFDAHRLSHLAKENNVQDKVEELLFAAYFTEGKNTQDSEVLTELAVKAGLDAEKVKNMLGSDRYADEVEEDIYTAQQIGVRGVPFFVLGGKYAISGAQESATFLQGLEVAWKETAANTTFEEGDVCGPDGCD